MIYLDNAATSFIKPASVYRAVEDTMRTCTSVGRGGYKAASIAAERVFDCRNELAELFNISDQSRFLFTYNATVAINMAIKGLVKNVGRVLVTGVEHNAVMRPLEALKKRGVRYSKVNTPLFNDDAFLEGFERQLKMSPMLAVCTHVSNVFGWILPIEEIDTLCFNHGVRLIIDASQSAGCVNLDMSKLRAAEFICMPGHKGLYGPQGTGVLVSLKGGESANTIIEGGTGSDSAQLEQPMYLPDRFESGTHNTPGIAGLCEGVKFVRQIGTRKILSHEKELVSVSARELEKHGFKVFFSQSENQSGVLSFIPPNGDCEHFVEVMASAGIALRAGLQCAPCAHECAGTSDTGTVRMSPSVFTTQRDIERFIIAAAHY